MPRPRPAAGNADTVTGILRSTGYDAIALRRCDLPIRMGHDLDEAVGLTMKLGPAGEILRPGGDRAAHVHDQIAEALREQLAAWKAPTESTGRPRRGSSRPPRAAPERAR